MTRGKIVLITDDAVLSSVEFNGGMYLDDDGYGQEIVQALAEINTADEHKAYVEEFNKEHHDYDDDPLVYDYTEDGDDEEELFNMAKDYYEKWFSDYLYIKNARDEEFEITSMDGKSVTIAPGGICVLYFGEYDSDCESASSGVTVSLDKKVVEICENLGWWVNVGDDDIEIGKGSPAGEDFFFTVSRAEPIKGIREYAGDFDPDEHAEMWLECRGRGGCPTSIRALIDDADAIADMLDELAMAFANFETR